MSANLYDLTVDDTASEGMPSVFTEVLRLDETERKELKTALDARQNDGRLSYRLEPVAHTGLSLEQFQTMYPDLFEGEDDNDQ